MFSDKIEENSVSAESRPQSRQRPRPRPRPRNRGTASENLIKITKISSRLCRGFNSSIFSKIDRDRDRDRDCDRDRGKNRDTLITALRVMGWPETKQTEVRESKSKGPFYF